MHPPTDDGSPAQGDAPARAGRPARRRRAVGPAGAAPAIGVDRAALLLEPVRAELPPDDDERLRREVPPHHGD